LAYLKLAICFFIGHCFAAEQHDTILAIVCQRSGVIDKAVLTAYSSTR